ncbi:galectin-7-like [Erythrolamprus reginae]|uniref:galectin-7-like n=1 Tax=Erythrolamprus reginae TaxID=121349 RepID=UPI00396CD62F
MSVYVRGTIHKDTNRRFNVDFTCGERTAVNIPFHINVLFYANKVVLNTLQAGRWGPQEVYQMPFRKGEDSEVLFIVTEAAYQILVNKKPFCTYKHRIPPQSVKVIHVNGDLELYSVNVTEPTTQNMVHNQYNQAGKWGPQEGHQMPFRKGEEFEVLFNVTEVGYQILVNKKPFCTYKHRIPPQSVKEVRVNGDLEVKSLNVTEPTMKNMFTLDSA